MRSRSGPAANVARAWLRSPAWAAGPAAAHHARSPATPALLRLGSFRPESRLVAAGRRIKSDGRPPFSEQQKRGGRRFSPEP